MDYGIFLIGLFTSMLIVRGAIPLAGAAGVVDHPSGHKTHTVPVPYVGGVGVLTALVIYCLLTWLEVIPAFTATSPVLLVCAGLMFVTGLADDRWKLSFRLRLIVEVGAVLLMVFGAGVVLEGFGELLVPGHVLYLGALGIPITVFCLVGVTNALNMIDGVDGLSGTLSVISLGLIALLAAIGGNTPGVVLALALAGGICGFLVFNLRWALQRRARVYLGDNGTMLIGFLIGWLLVDLSQGPEAVIQPVTALYLFALPLLDSVMAIIRRVWLGRSPFQPDRSHLHHMLLDAGASVETAVWLLAALHLVIGCLGVAGFLSGTPESVMFLGYLLVFSCYGYLIARPWRFVPRMRRAMMRMGIPLEHSTGVFIGRFSAAQLPLVVARAREVLRPEASLRAYVEIDKVSHDEAYFVVLDQGSWYAVRSTVSGLRKALSSTGAFEIRQYADRKLENDPRKDDISVASERRCCDRRCPGSIRELKEYRVERLVMSRDDSHRPQVAHGLK